MSCFPNDSELLFLIFFFFLLLFFYACAKYHLYIGISNRNYSMAAMIWFLPVSKIISMKANYCAKSVCIRIHSGPHFPAFGLNTDQNNSKYRHFLRSEQYTGSNYFLIALLQILIHLNQSDQRKNLTNHLVTWDLLYKKQCISQGSHKLLASLRT